MYIDIDASEKHLIATGYYGPVPDELKMLGDCLKNHKKDKFLTVYFDYDDCEKIIYRCKECSNHWLYITEDYPTGGTDIWYKILSEEEVILVKKLLQKPKINENQLRRFVPSNKIDYILAQKDVYILNKNK